MELGVPEGRPVGVASAGWGLGRRGAGGCALAGVGGWAPPLLHATCLTMLQLAGHLFMRLVEPFQEWPYAMGRLVHASVPEAIRRETAAALWEANECCTTPSDGWTDPLRRLLRGPEEALSEPWCQTLLRDLFERIPASTILVEDAFLGE